MSGTINGLQDRIGRLVNENSGMENEMRTVQENLRLSTSQNQKIMKEINEYRDRLSSNEQESEVLKRKIQKLLQERLAILVICRIDRIQHGKCPDDGRCIFARFYIGIDLEDIVGHAGKLLETCGYGTVKVNDLFQLV